MKKPFVLMVLDGWGYREEKADNAIMQARKPTWDALWKTYPHMLISGSGKDVGLPDQQMGNSEVGHTNLGAGRIVYQDLTRIDAAIEEGSFFKNPVLVNVTQKVKQTEKSLHIMGLLSSGGIHSHENQIQAMIQLAAQQGLKQVYLHAFLDGRDTPPKSAAASLARFDATLKSLRIGRVASIIGRYYAMDRDKRWERVQQAYDLLTEGKASYRSEDAITAINAAYDRGETDEFVKPTLIAEPHVTPAYIQAGDAVVFMNFRSDRARQLTHAFVDDHFMEFHRPKKLSLGAFVTLTEYETGLPVSIAFPSYTLNEVLGEYLAHQGLTQLRIAETEKYAHVTFFFNGGVETPFPGEDRILVPSPKVATYDLKPEMSAPELTEQLIAAIHSQKYDVIICNYANADMVGHTGNLSATVRAIETLDICLGHVITALKKVGGEALITADHGNAEMMHDHETGQAHTAHTNLEVPLVYVGRPAEPILNNGKLSDVAPTLLSLMGLPPPKEMTGRILFKLT